MSKNVEFDKDAGVFIFECPHCSFSVQVGINEINCSIFRHGYYFINNNGNIILTEQLNPHAPKEVCDRLVEENRIVGCGKPFRFVVENNKMYVVDCGYI